MAKDTRAGAPMAETDDENEERHETILFFVEFSCVNNVSMVLDGASVALELNSASKSQGAQRHASRGADGRHGRRK